ncbi:heavy metal translocating P-type ATPase [Neisseria dumasiana]|uniref:Copper-translocating P-type ATPase n=1 Tax=Neisseria dumasiana TaxID=1931275 RepID=A0ABX3WLV2_9NEIS|nr:heavy metal translocating P-type ATPase [Neisseria dumasiana]OSI35401.1 copper-translocating P-type ATPase [Neisseria dumasiana]UOO85058.1 heavy metal translocating P-type ATPase [Neisseria dumasiana]
MKKTCFHCGLDVPDNISLPVVYEGESHDTCCAGCQAVAQSIIDAGLGNYYKQRTADAQQAALPPQEILDRLKLYDMPEVQAGFVETGADGVSEAVLMLGGITCAACVWLIEQQLLRTEGIVRADLNYSTRRVRVVWHNDKVSLSDILLLIQKTGYTAVPYDARKMEEQMQAERKQALIRLAVAGLSMMQTMMFAAPTYLYGNEIEPLYLGVLHWGAFLMVLPAMFYSAVPFYKGFWRDLKNRRMGMDTPVAIAISLTFLAGVYGLISNAGQGMYFESVAMFVFFLLGGRYMEQIARRKAGDAAERLVKLVPAFCHTLPNYPENDTAEEAAVVQLKTGDVVAVYPGEVIPVDGTVLSGESEVNEAMLTGESLPVLKQQSAKVTAGTLNTLSPLVVRTDQVGGDTRLSHIVKLLDRALAQKPRLAEMADKYASTFVSGLLIAAVPVFIGWTIYAGPFQALWITVSLLVITCPCALSLATPTALAASTGMLASDGILVSGSRSLETLSQIDDVVFDKTGTLTKGTLAVTRAIALGRLKTEEAAAIAKALESQSEHPIAKAIIRYAEQVGGNLAALQVGQRVNHVGKGVSASLTVNGETQIWALGTADFVAGIAGVPLPAEHIEHSGSIVYLGNEQGFQTAFLLEDEIKESVADMIAALKKQGMHLHLLSGDREAAVAGLTASLGLDTYRAEALPEDKLAYVETLQRQQRKVLMVGDGINDAPVLAQADVSVAVAGGADVAREGADVILLNDDMRVLPHTINQARRTRAVIRQNLIWASVYNLIVIPLAVFGYVTPWIAALGMSFSSLIVAANALRLLKKRPSETEWQSVK